MLKRFAIVLTLIILTIDMTSSSVLAQSIEPNGGTDFVSLLPAALMLLLPIGVILLVSSAMPEIQAPVTATNLLTTWAVAVLAYFTVGFAFQFGGIAQVSPHPDFTGLYWEWYPLDQSVDVEVARLWGVIALQGWALAGAAATPGALRLFAAHLSLVGLAAAIPAATLLRYSRRGMALLIGSLMGALIYPLAGNWLWGGGWLSHLGTSLGLGHGFVDFGGASVVFLTGSMVTLIALLMFNPTDQEDNQAHAAEEVVIAVSTDTPLTVYSETDIPTSPQEALQVTPMPSAYLPILGLLGSGLVLLGWFGLAAGLHVPTGANVSPAQAGVNGILSALSAAFAAATYSWFTTRDFNPLMTSRGLVAGLVLATAGAPYVPPWVFVAAGLVMGLILPSLIYLFNQGLHLADELGTLAVYGMSAIVSLLLVPLFADGRAGQGWNGVGIVAYGGIDQQGVSGLMVAPGFAADWPGQFQAQLLGIAAVAVLAAVAALLLFQTIKVVAKSWAGSGLEFGSSVVDGPTSTAIIPSERESQTLERREVTESYREIES